MPMQWFIPIGLGLGFAGTRTAWRIRNGWGRGRRLETMMVAVLAWLPLLIWAIASFSGTPE